MAFVVTGLSLLYAETLTVANRMELHMHMLVGCNSPYLQKRKVPKKENKVFTTDQTLSNGWQIR